MRYVLPALFALTCIVSCGAKPKAAAPSAAPPSEASLRLTPDGPSVALAVPAGWRAMPSKPDDGNVVLVRQDGKEEAIAIVLQETGLDDKVEEVTTRWAMLAATLLKGFHVTDMEEPKYPSDGESSFLVWGEDDAKRKQILICRIRQVGSRTSDFWAIILSTGPNEDAQALTDASERVVRSLHIQPTPAPK